MEQFDHFHGFNVNVDDLWTDFQSNPSAPATPMSDPYYQQNSHQNTQQMPQHYEYNWSMPQQPMTPTMAEEQNHNNFSVPSWNQSDKFLNFDQQPCSNYTISAPSTASSSTGSLLRSSSTNSSTSSAQFSPDYQINSNSSSDYTASTSGFFDATDSSNSSWSSLEDAALPAGMPQNSIQHQSVEQEPVWTYVTATNMTKAVMEAFYADPEKDKCTVVIKHPKFIKKSYNKEIRYLTPFPVVSILGRGWATNKFMPRHGVRPTFLEVSMGFANRDNLPEMDLIAGTIVNRHFRSKPLSTDETSTTTKLNTKIRIATDYDFGTITSSKIIAPSKPSKSRKAIPENVDAFSDCHFIENGWTVGVFNRFKKANSDPGLLYASESGKIGVDSGMWSVFQIDVVKSFDQKHGSDIVNENGVNIFDADDKDFVQYGDTVVLTDTVTHFALAPVVIRKVEHFNSKYVVSAECGECVSQQDYVAFEFISETGPCYLLSKDDGLGVYVSDTKVSGLSCLTEFSKWTIISAKVTENTFAPLLQTPIKPIAPFPKVKNVIPDGEGFFQVLLAGVSDSFTIWIGVLQALNAQFIHEDHMTRIRASIPPPEDYSIYQPNEFVPISLVRDDGVVYMTDFYFCYTNLMGLRHDRVRFVHSSEIDALNFKLF